MLYRRSGMGRASRRQRGAVAVTVGISMAVLLGFGAFAIDFGRWLVVRNELQNAADASALAGAGYLLNPAVNGKPNWATATTQGHQAVTLNGSEAVALQAGVVTPGYWDFSARTFDTDTAKVPTADDLPAVRVAIARTPGQNSGPMLTTLGRILGVNQIDAAATATAVVSVPNSAGAGQLAPIAVANCMLEAGTGLWDPANNKPILDGSGNPLKFVVASGAANTNHCNGCQCGQWTTFGVDNNSASYTRGLIQNGNATAVPVGDDTWIQPGMEAALYGDFDTYLAGRNIVVPIVADGTLDSKGRTPVLKYACLHVLKAVQGGNKNKVCNEYDGQPLKYGQTENKCIIASFANQPCPVGEANGTSGTFSGVYVPPRLVQ